MTELVKHGDLIKRIEGKKDFKNEKALCDYLEANIKSFTRDSLGGELKRFKRPWALSKLRSFGSNKPSIDFMIELESGERIGIECKKPTFVFSELHKGISQLLAYSVIAERNDCKIDRLILIADRFDIIIYEIIKKYNLPIEFYVLTKEFLAKLIIL